VRIEDIGDGEVASGLLVSELFSTLNRDVVEVFDISFDITLYNICAAASCPGFAAVPFFDTILKAIARDIARYESAGLEV